MSVLSSSAQEATPAPAAKPDAVASKFMLSCAGCHSLSGLKLNGPELSHVHAWPVEQLKTAIKRMEQRVGPISDEDTAALAELLRDANVRDRLKAEEARIQAQFMAKMEPPDEKLGRQLFFGATPFANGGLACSACHETAGEGGNLGPALDGSFAKMGRTPLLSSIEKTGFKVMEPHYRRKPVTQQEAAHLVKYLSTLDPKRAPAAHASFAPLGAGIALAALAGLVLHYRKGRAGRGQRLQRRRK